MVCLRYQLPPFPCLVCLKLATAQQLFSRYQPLLGVAIVAGASSILWLKLALADSQPQAQLPPLSLLYCI